MFLRSLSNWKLEQSASPHPVTHLLNLVEAAILIIAIGVAAFIKPPTPPKVPAIAIADPAGEIPVPALQNAQSGQQNTITTTEPISVAILPLE